MSFLQQKLNVKVSQKQVLTPGLVQMVSVLALNKMELKEMINAEIVENPVLEELDESTPVLDEVQGAEEAPAEITEIPKAERDPFDEIDFGSYFQDYLDPGFRSPDGGESDDRPSFENFLSQPSTLTDHLLWQLGPLHLKPEVHEAAELIIGNLNEDGYLTASEAELLASLAEELAAHTPDAVAHALPAETPAILKEKAAEEYPAALRSALAEALRVVRGFDPAGIAARDLRECLLIQIDQRGHEAALLSAAGAAASDSALLQKGVQEALAHSEAETIDALARTIISEHLPHLQKRDLREMAKLTGSSQAQVQSAIDLIRSLDPKPGRRYNREEARLIEPDVAFVKRDGEYVVVMNEDDLPTLRLNQGYRRMITQGGADRDVRDYVKERYRSAIQLMRNIEQRRNTILRTCEAIVHRQQEFMENGVEALHPMMIKEVAEEIGVHPSTVSRAVANKYVHTPQGVFELRFFFSEGVNGPEGAETPLLLLKRKVKKMIEEEDRSKPLTDDAIALALREQGINVTRRTVAKYREDMGLPSTHQRRVRS